MNTLNTYKVVHIVDGYREVNSYITAHSQEYAVYKARTIYKFIISVTEV